MVDEKPCENLIFYSVCGGRIKSVEKLWTYSKSCLSETAKRAKFHQVLSDFDTSFFHVLRSPTQAKSKVTSEFKNLQFFKVLWTQNSKSHRKHRTLAKRSGLESEKCTALKRDSIPGHLRRAGNFPCSPKVPWDRVPLQRRAFFAFQAASFWESSMYSMTFGSVPWSKH